MSRGGVKMLAQGALIAALYIVLTYLSHSLSLANGVIQVRLSEALTILPFFMPAAIWGLTVGCALSNLLTGCAPYDILFGSFATLVGAFGTYALKKYKWLSPVPPIVANTVVVPLILSFVYKFEQGLPYLFLTVGIGEIISCGVLGMVLLFALKPYAKQIFNRG